MAYYNPIKRNIYLRLRFGFVQLKIFEVNNSCCVRRGIFRFKCVLIGFATPNLNKIYIFILL